MIDTIAPLIKQFLPFAQERMGFKKPPRMFLRDDASNADNPLGKTAFYDPENISVTLYTTNRHVKDVMRSLAHELVHHAQHERGEFENCGEMGEGYAQNDEHLREMEREAYEVGNMCFRDWEDGIKNTIYFEHLNKGEQKKMSTKNWKNNEIKSLLSEAWGFKMDLNKLTEERTGSGIDHGGDDDEEAKEETEGKADSKREEEGLKEGEEEVTEKKDPDWGEDDHEYKRKTVGGVKKKAGDVDGHYKDYEGPTGGNKGDKSKTHPGRKDYEKNESQLSEDAGSEEAWHQWKNEHADDDHIKEIENHLRALKDDRDYERHEAEYDHDKYEDEGYRKDERVKIENKIRSMVRKALSEVAKATKG